MFPCGTANRLDHAIDVFYHLPIHESDDTPAIAFKIPRSPFIIGDFFNFTVCGSIDLDHKTSFDACKVGDERPYRRLSSETIPYRTPAKLGPKQNLRARHVLAHSPREISFLDISHVARPHPPFGVLPPQAGEEI